MKKMTQAEFENLGRNSIEISVGKKKEDFPIDDFDNSLKKVLNLWRPYVTITPSHGDNNH